MTSKTDSNFLLPPCRFCTYLAQEEEPDGIDCPWLATDKYAALVSIGAMLPGWTLVCPSQHRLNLIDDYSKEEFWSFASRVEKVVRNRYGKVSVFEHGARATESETSCGTAHAHLHMVPLNFALTIEALRFDPQKKWRPCLATQIEERTNGQEYLFVADHYEADMTQGLLCVLETGISQFFRRVIGRRVGLTDFYDYRNYPMIEIAEESARALREDVRTSHA